MANVPHEGIPYGKPSPGRNPIAELPQGGIIPCGTPPPPGRNPMAELPQEGIIPYGKPSPSMANLLQHKLHKLCNIGTACAIFVGRGGGEKSMGGWGGGGSYVTPDSPYSGNMVYPQQKKIRSIQL